jgi:hypothetical protein
VWTLAWGLAVTPVAARAPVVRAAPASEAPASEADTRARLEAIYGAANEAIAAGNHAAAAERYAEVLRVLGESRETHESRALALLDSVAARRVAQTQGLPQQLCRARDLTREYLAAATAAHGDAAGELDGVRQATRLARELADEISRLSDPTCPGDQAPAPAPGPAVLPGPAPEPGPDRRVVAGGVLLGVGGLALGLMATGLGLGARTTARLREARRADPGRDIDALLAGGLIQRGQASNRLAIAGSVLAGLTLVAGATLLILGKTRVTSPRAARLPRLDVIPGGVGLRF